MTAPPKPWENRVGIGDILGTAGTGISPNRNVLNSAAPQLTSQPIGSVRTSALPPLPPRPAQLSTTNRPTFGMSPSMYGGYSGYGGGYGGYSSFGSGYGMSSGYGSMYGGYPGSYGYGSYGQPGNMFENRFLQAAEESSRGAFQSIESLVRAFTSVSMMLESTYHAMYSSFRAILGVVDNFSKLRQMFAQFISAITILKMIKSFYQRLLYWLGIVKQNPVSEQIWETAATGETSVPKTSAWPLFTFVGLLFGGPYLISKFFTPSITEPKKWDPKSGTFYKAAYPYEATSESELSFSDNEVLNVAPSEMQLQNNNGWLLAANRQGNIGYIPVTRLAPQRQIITSQLTDTSFNKPNSDCIPTSELAEKNKD